MQVTAILHRSGSLPGTKPARPPMGVNVGSDGGDAPSRINVTGTYVCKGERT